MIWPGRDVTVATVQTLGIEQLWDCPLERFLIFRQGVNPAGSAKIPPKRIKNQEIMIVVKSLVVHPKAWSQMWLLTYFRGQQCPKLNIMFTLLIMTPQLIQTNA